jgi:hypothetical protein
MIRTVFAAIVAVLCLAPLATSADDKTPSDATASEQAKIKKEADARKAANAKMTPEQKAAAKKARDAERLKYESTIENITQNPKENRNMGINKSAADSKSAPTPPRGMINTPEAEKLLLKQKGQ